MSDEVVSLDSRRPPANIECECGSQWFTAVVAFSVSGSVIGYGRSEPYFPKCLACGKDAPFQSIDNT